MAFEPSERYKIGRTLLQYSGNNVGPDGELRENGKQVLKQKEVRNNGKA
ncbi:MAG: hypothetical protein GY938_18960 [Ketobacter sp.]|nr:hypothetical protein [Planctomycetota bacterium]MCP5017325.1 hypothetical protein [Ketobacter sp.]